MAVTKPIKSKEDLAALKNYYLRDHPNLRNYALICTGINTALRISDILALTWRDVYDFERRCFRSHLSTREAKTGKETSIALNQSLRDALSIYRQSIPSPRPGQYLFPGKKPKEPLSRTQAYRIIHQAGENLHLPDAISCHTLRKTFGYHAWISGVNPAVLMIIYNHSTFQITKRYLGIDQDDKDNVFLNLNL